MKMAYSDKGILLKSEWMTSECLTPQCGWMKDTGSPGPLTPHVNVWHCSDVLSVGEWRQRSGGDFWESWGGAELALVAFILSKAELIQKGDHRGLSKQNTYSRGMCSGESGMQEWLASPWFNWITWDFTWDDAKDRTPHLQANSRLHIATWLAPPSQKHIRP